MSEVAEELLKKAMHLSADERLKLATLLMESVEGPVDDESWDAAWLNELRRRESEPTVDLGEALAKSRSALKQT